MGGLKKLKILIAGGGGGGWLLNCFFFTFLTMKTTVLRTFVFTVKVK